MGVMADFPRRIKKRMKEMKAISVKQLKATVELGEEQMELLGKSISGS